MPSPCSSPGSYSEPDIILPPSQDGNETASTEQLHAYASSPGDLRSMDYDEMSLPEMPFIGVLETGWSENNGIDFPEVSPTTPPSPHLQVLTCAEAPRQGSDWSVIRHTELPQNDHKDNLWSACSVDASVSTGLCFEPSLLSPILATTSDIEPQSPLSPCSITRGERASTPLPLTNSYDYLHDSSSHLQIKDNCANPLVNLTATTSTGTLMNSNVIEQNTNYPIGKIKLSSKYSVINYINYSRQPK